MKQTLLIAAALLSSCARAPFEEKHAITDSMSKTFFVRAYTVKQGDTLEWLLEREIETNHALRSLGREEFLLCDGAGKYSFSIRDVVKKLNANNPDLVYQIGSYDQPRFGQKLLFPDLNHDDRIGPTYELPYNCDAACKTPSTIVGSLTLGGISTYSGVIRQVGDNERIFFADKEVHTPEVISRVW